jgi:hypothetical protein
MGPTPRATPGRRDSYSYVGAKPARDLEVANSQMRQPSGQSIAQSEDHLLSVILEEIRWNESDTLVRTIIPNCRELAV